MTIHSDQTCESCDHVGLVEFFNQKGHFLLRCPKCDLYQKGILESAIVYENDYHVRYAKRLPGKQRTATIRLGAAARHLPETPRHLDIGCSIGATVRAATELGWDTTGVDISQTAVDFCVRDGYDCYKIDGVTLPFRDNTFDLVTNWHVIEHVPDVAEALAEWKRVLKPGGVLMMETPASNYLKVKLLGPKYRRFWPADHLYTFNSQNLASILSKAGYEMLPNRLTGGLTYLKPHQTAYALAYRGYRETCRRLSLCRSFEVICRKPAEQAVRAA